MPVWRTATRAAAAVLTTALIVTTATTGSPATAARAARQPTTFQVASFNMLGSQHTAHSTSWSSGTVRARMAKRWLRREGTSVAGVQEAQVDQMRALTRSGEWASFPDPRTSRDTQTAQSVAWRATEWTLVEARTFRIPFDRSQVREQPVVLLRHRATGAEVWFVSVHFTAGPGQQAVGERRTGLRRLARQVAATEAADDRPIVVTGDMNDHSTAFCAMTRRTSLVTPAGGSNDSLGCVAPAAMRVDWIFGSQQLSWSDFRFADDEDLHQITDHTVPVATVTLG